MISKLFSKFSRKNKTEDMHKNIYLDERGRVSDGTFTVHMAHSPAERNEYHYLRGIIFDPIIHPNSADGAPYEHDEYDNPNITQGFTEHFLIRHNESGINVGCYRLITRNDPALLPTIDASKQDNILPDGFDEYSLSVNFTVAGRQLTGEMPPFISELSRFGISKERMNNANLSKGTSPYDLMFISALIHTNSSGIGGIPLLSVTEERLLQKGLDHSFIPHKQGKSFVHHGTRIPLQYDYAKCASDLETRRPSLVKRLKSIFSPEEDLTDTIKHDPFLKHIYDMRGNIAPHDNSYKYYDAEQKTWFTQDEHGEWQKCEGDAPKNRQKTWAEICKEHGLK